MRSDPDRSGFKKCISSIKEVPREKGGRKLDCCVEGHMGGQYSEFKQRLESV